MANLLGTTITGDMAVTGAGSGQGFIPLGGIVPIHSGITGAHSVPSAAAVDVDGFMICDGSTIPGGQTCSGSCPDLTDGRFLRGNTHGNVGAAAGADSHAVVEGNTPQHSHTGPSHTHTGPSHTHTGPNHQHTGPNHQHSGPNHSHTFSENRNFGQNVNTNAGNHTHQFFYGRWLTGPAASYAMIDAGHPGTGSCTQSGSHGHNFNFGQNQNYGGGSNHTGTGNYGNSGTGGSAHGGTGGSGHGGTGAAGHGGTGASANYGAGSVTATPTLPVYMQAVYLIRVI